jgi:MraZ protein
VWKGTYLHRIDAKGRLPIPAPIRHSLQDSGHSRVVVARFDQCLAAFAPPEWGKLENDLLALSFFDPKARATQRLLTKDADDCEIDVQGRILLPPNLREGAGLERDAVVVGVLNRFEIWSPPAWDAFLSASESLLDTVSAGLQWPPAAMPAGPASPTGAAHGIPSTGKPNA